MHKVAIQNRHPQTKVTSSAIRTLVRRILRAEGKTGSLEVSIVFCDDDFIQRLNRAYRGKDRPTDVLSFPLDGDDEDTLLGDIVISLDTALRQSKNRIPLDLELQVLLIHGLLHLLGYDHDTPSRRKKMFHKTDEYLEQFAAGFTIKNI